MLLLASAKEAAKRKNGRRNEVPSLKAIERESLGVKVNPRTSQVKHLNNKIAVVDVKAWGIGPQL
jgi:hypothetical protein